MSDYSNWMGDYHPDTPFKLLSMPGAHDSGMYKVQTATNLGSLAGGQNTQTQNKRFAHMLQDGIRYFDVRPGYYIENKNTKFRTGHFTNVWGIGTVGATGADLDELFSDVLDFLQKTKSEIVILKFSHYFQYTAESGSVDNTIMDDGDHDSIFDPMKADLVQQVISKFSSVNGTNWLLKSDNNLVTANKTAYEANAANNDLPWRIWNCSVKELADGHSRLIAVFDDVDNLSAKDRTYSYKDMVPNPGAKPLVVLTGDQLPKADLVVYDCYSNDDDIDDVIKDQVSKYNNQSNHTGDLYLLSWTATQGIFDQMNSAGFTAVISPFLALLKDTSIQHFAGKINPKLKSTTDGLKLLTSNMAAPFIPNIIYADFADYDKNGKLSDTFIADICISINTKVAELLLPADQRGRS